MEPSRSRIIAAMLPSAQGNPRALLRIAELLRAEGERARAVAVAQEALALAGEDREAEVRCQAFLARGVPKWHFRIVQDARRNAAYDGALRRTIRPGARVLEIGAGTGILAMMAARAGAERVFTCEMNPAVAEAARANVAANGYADRVEVVAKHSNALTEADLGGRVDILVSEIVSNDVIGEGVLEAHEQAVRDLLVSGGQVIPARGMARVALAEDRRWGERALGTVDGFDLSAFNRLAWPSHTLPVGADRLALRSDCADLFTFDFASPVRREPDRVTLDLRSRGGRVNGIVQWLALAMDSADTYEAAPGSMQRSAWALMFHPFAAPVDTAPGQPVRVHGSHDRIKLTIWSD